jgi:GT2 family glycosyltransferase
MFPTWRAIAGRRFGLKRIFARSLREYFCQDRDPRGAFVCDWVSGCFMLVRREAIRDVGRFDERYVKYFEDVDVCLRMARAGWQVMFNGQTRCYHYEQRASRQLLSRDAWLHARAYLRWLLKWGLANPNPVRPPGEQTVMDVQKTGARGLRRDGAHESAARPERDAPRELGAPRQSDR